MTESRGQKYPPLANYGYIGDCHAAALISKAGSIDWCCLPRMDDHSCFGRLLDWDKGGYCQMAPAGEYQSRRRYLENTLVLETTFVTDKGEARLLDCLTMRQGGRHLPHRQLLRVLEGLQGRVEFKLELEPRFDYGSIQAWIRCKGNGCFHPGGGPSQ